MFLKVVIFLILSIFDEFIVDFLFIFIDGGIIGNLNLFLVCLSYIFIIRYFLIVLFGYL